jgi:outer membrane biosynthesis protein TonB
LNAGGTQRHETTSAAATSKGPLIASLLFHLVLFLLATFGIPYISKDHVIQETPITVEMVDISEIAQTTNVARPVEKPLEEPEEEPPPPEKPEPPKMTSEAPPEVMPEPPEIEEEITEDLPEPELAEPVETKEPAVKPKQKPKPPATKTAKTAPKKDFQSLLKNLTPDAAEQKPEPQEEAGENPQTAQVANLSDRLTMSELDAVRRQLAQCWNILAGAKYAEDLVVEVRVTINRDRTVQSATILNQSRYNRDANFRAAADAATRALRNPRCNPLNLPPEKYDFWRVTIINFDPREIL